MATKSAYLKIWRFFIKSVEEIKKIVAKTAGESEVHYNKVLSMLAYERAIARLVQDPVLVDSIIFKGGLVMRAVYGSDRATSDLDASFRGMGIESLKAKVEENLAVDLGDHFRFEKGKWKPIAKGRDYGGVRYSSILVFGGEKVVSLSFDFTVSELSEGFRVKKLGKSGVGESFSARVYSREMIVAEKLQTFVSRGEGNSRAKDIFDINFLTAEKLNRKELKKNIERVFKARGTPFPKSFEAFSRGIDSSSLRGSWRYFGGDSLASDFDSSWSQFKKNLASIDSDFHTGISL